MPTITPIVVLPQRDLPPLPVIADAAMRAEVFSHPKNAKLAHIGDSILGEQISSSSTKSASLLTFSPSGMVAVIVLDDHWPGLDKGDATVGARSMLFRKRAEIYSQSLKAVIVNNEVLALVSDGYGLICHLIGQKGTGMSLANSTKTKATLLEAYIAGVYHIARNGPVKRGSGNGNHGLHVRRSHGEALDRVSDWLTPLVRFLAEEGMRRVRDTNKNNRITYPSHPLFREEADEEIQLVTPSFKYPPSGTSSVEDSDDDSDGDSVVIGAAAALNQYLADRGRPAQAFDFERLGEQAWRATASTGYGSL